ncbi:tagaturonate reductase [Escherichia coli]|nr:tagaturonate reductase [Escherichia coli]
MHVQPISTFRLFQEGHLLRNSIAIFVLTTLFYFIGAELRLVHELSLFWPLNGVMAGVFARYVWLNRLHYYAISYVAMLVYDAITTEWGLVSLAINFSNMMFIVTVALLVARDKRLGKNKYEPVSALRLFNYCLLAALLCAIVGAIGSVSIDSLDFWPLLADWFSEQFSTGVLSELVLRYAQEWALPEAFIQWLDQANSFCSTLVDRIVTGYPRDEVAKLEEELGYHDGFLDTAEHFYLFVIQGPKSLATELRLDKYPLNVLIVDDIKPYKERKVAILNGAHTALVPVAFQAGLDTVGEAMNDAEICAFVEKAIYEEIIPVLDLPRDELESFASAVTGRFRNPYIKHQLLSIALNGMTKFRTRILPQLLAGQKANGTLPARLTFALAALIAFYRGERNGETYPVQDDAHWLERYQQLWSQYRDRVIGTQELVAIVLAEKDHWEQDLTQVLGLVEQVANDLDAILEKGMREAVRPLC